MQEVGDLRDRKSGGENGFEGEPETRLVDGDTTLVPGVELIEMQEASLCCGSAGVYNITRPAMAQTLGDRKARHVRATDAQAVVTANPGCYLQLRASLQRAGVQMHVLHIVDVLDAAYRDTMPV